MAQFMQKIQAHVTYKPVLDGYQNHLFALSFYWIKFFFHYVCASAKLHGISLHLWHVSP
jgi:hypothetical protein